MGNKFNDLTTAFLIKQIKKLDSEEKVLGVLLNLGIFLLAGAFLANYFSGNEDWDGWITSLLQNLSTEMFGAFIIFVLLEKALGSLKEVQIRREAEEKELQGLLRSLEDRDKAKAALKELRDKNWLYDGKLTGANLRNARLNEAELYAANLVDADLSLADLSDAKLMRANDGYPIK